MGSKAAVNLKEVLRAAMARQGVSQTELGNIADRSQAWVSGYVLNNPEKALRNLWVEEPCTFHAIIEKLGLDADSIMSTIGVSSSSNAIPIPLSRAIPVYPAGAGPALEDDGAVEWIHVPVKAGGTYEVIGLRITGDSMRPYLAPGEIAVIACEASLAKPGQKVAVYLPDSGHVVKTLVRLEPTIMLESLQVDDGEPRFFEAPDNTRILGPVVNRITDG